MEEGELAEIGVLRGDRIAVLAGELPHLDAGCGVQAEFHDVSAVWELLGRGRGRGGETGSGRRETSRGGREPTFPQCRELERGADMIGRQFWEVRDDLVG